MKNIFTIIILLIGLQIQAQDSLNMSLLYRYDSDTIPQAGSRHYNECFGYVACDGSEIAILGSSGRVHFFDVTDPVNSYEIAWFAGGQTSVWRDMKTYKDHVYSVCDSCNEGLMVFDMADAPNTVTQTNQTTEFFSRSHNVFVDEPHGRLYAVGTDSLGNGIVVLDVETNPDTPILLKNMVLPGGYVHDMYIKDHLAFCNHGGNGMYAYDFTDLDNPILLGTLTDYAESGYNHSSWVNEDFTTLVLCDETHNRGVKTINIEDPSNMFVEEVFRSTLNAPTDTASIAHNPLIRGNIAFVSYYHDGVQVYDISDPANVENIAYYDTEPNDTVYNGFRGSWGVYPFFPSGNIIASDLQNGLFVLSLENVDLIPVEPTLFANTTIENIGFPMLCDTAQILLYTDAFTTPEIEPYTYIWFNGDEAVAFEDPYIASEAGNYTVCITNGHCSTCTLEPFVVTEIETTNVNLMVEGDTEFCKGKSTELMVEEGADNYVWRKDEITVFGENEASLSVTESGNYEVTATTGSCNKTSQLQEITVFETPSFPISNDDNILLSEAGTTYQWFFENEAIAGANEQEYEATENGNYYVIITNDEGCEVTSETLNVVINSIGDIAILDKFNAFPNPVTDVLTIEMSSSKLADFTIELQTIDGRILKTIKKQVTGTVSFGMNTADFASGIYLLKVKNEENVFTKKINKQ